MWKSDLEIDKYWVTHSGYFRLATTVELSMEIIDGELLFCHGISEESVDKKISTRDYNNKTVYECLNIPFPYDCGIPYLNIHPIIIYYRPRPHKRARYTPDLISDSI